jgi:hypothetical protein
MAQSHVVSGLLQKRSELMGLIEVKRKELDGLIADLNALDMTCRLFDESVSFSENKPKRLYKKNRLFAHGEASRLVLESLRGQAGIKIGELADTISQQKSFGDEVRAELMHSLDKTLRFLEKKEQVQRTKDGSQNLWALT